MSGTELFFIVKVYRILRAKERQRRREQRKTGGSQKEKDYSTHAEVSDASGDKCAEDDQI